MKTTSLLITASAAATTCAGAASLRGEGIEEVSGKFETFPYEDVHIDRRILLEDETTESIEDVFDEWPDQDIMGHIVRDEDAVYVKEWYGEEGEYEEWSDQYVVGNVVEDEDAYGEWFEDEEIYDEDASIIKEYAPDPDRDIIVGNNLMGEDVDQYNRREAECDGNKSEFKIMLITDNYAYETKWKIINTQNNVVIDEGPPPNSNYADKTPYSGRWCLSPGQYKFEITDSGKDGICSSNASIGCGRLMLFLNGADAGSLVNDQSDWKTKAFPFTVAFSTRIDMPNDNNSNINSPWCNKVRSVMQVPKGTCTLPNGRRGHHVRVTTKVDKFGKETKWTITHKDDNVEKMKMGPVIEANQQKSVEDCLPAGKYNLKFEDFDGICCRYGEGFFKLIVDGNELLAGGSFTKSIDHDFQLGFDWISSMSDRDCEWWWAHDYRRRDWHTRCYPGEYCNKTYRHLKWSPALKADAQVYATKLLGTCANNGIEHDDTDQGENISKNRGFDNWGAQYSADQVTSRFVDKEEFWGWSRNSHLTQAIWYPTRYMGCAESVKDMGKGKMCRMQVCRYAKPGNCGMDKYDSGQGNNWMKPMMMDDSPCGPICASRDGCYH